MLKPVEVMIASKSHEYAFRAELLQRDSAFGIANAAVPTTAFKGADWANHNLFFGDCAANGKWPRVQSSLPTPISSNLISRISPNSCCASFSEAAATLTKWCQSRFGCALWQLSAPEQLSAALGQRIPPTQFYR
jgi:hypothetical protein